ncbi:unnamed protein product [Periconia digitata]|uniref:Uncharacterized protein n=1 Tax=Periconia digitata TaxID=1303443 RepID=A0A9W4U4S0_9PLEO|nr:unnamed protein product [Periconia digitata]
MSRRHDACNSNKNSGIGFSLTKQSVALGARVLVSDIRSSPSFDSFAASNLSNVLFVQSDVTRWSDFTKLFDSCEKKWSDVPDAYGICAGLFEPPASNFWQDPEQDAGYKQVDVNVDHPIKLTRLAIKKSLGKGKRASVCIIVGLPFLLTHIVHIKSNHIDFGYTRYHSSIGGISSNVAAPLYCATKHAIVGFVKCMSTSEAFTGVKVTTICPGLVDTPLLDTQKVEQYSVTKANSLSPDEVATQMLKVIQEKKYGCGTVLEVSKAGTRVIPEWNVDPPRGSGTGLEKEEVAAGAKAMLEPILKKLESEKRTSKL